MERVSRRLDDKATPELFALTVSWRELDKESRERVLDLLLFELVCPLGKDSMLFDILSHSSLPLGPSSHVDTEGVAIPYRADS
jgi:hypothetical protein